MKKIPVGILGATGMVGQKFVELLASHPWFEITAVAASDRSIHKPYKTTIHWTSATPLPKQIGDMPISACLPDLPCKLVFSALDSRVAGEIETAFAQAGYIVISNARNHRMDAQVPLLIPEVNPEHFKLVDAQHFHPGAILTNPNCSTIGICLALKPMLDQWGLEAAHIVTLQALSGAGYPGVASMDILDNVIPFIEGEEDKIENEPLKILGWLEKDQIIPNSLKISAQCNRIAVSDGHMACLSVKLKKKAKKEDIIQAWTQFQAEPQHLKLPTAPSQPIVYHEEANYPQPKLHRNLGNGMAISIGRLRECSLYDWKFNILSHNTVRGAAGGALLIAEMLHRNEKGLG